MVEYNQIKHSPPPVSEKPKTAPENRAPKKAVITKDQVVKPSLFSRTMNAMFGREKMKSINNYVVHEVIVPAAKEMLRNSLYTGIDMMIYRDGVTPARGAWNQPNSVGHRMNYTGYSQVKYYPSQQATSWAKMQAPTDDIVDVQEQVVVSRESLVEVLGLLQDEIRMYGAATLADYYDYSGMPSTFTDQHVGWRNLSTASIRPVRGGWELVMPPVEQL